jgi:hypothetical protein
MDAETGKLMRRDSIKASLSSKAASAPTKPPKLSVSKVSSLGQFSLKLTDPMNLEAFLNTTQETIKGVNDTSEM